MRRFLISCLLACAGSCGSDESDDTFCCTVKGFCTDCTTCSASERTIGKNGDEEACRVIVDDWIRAGRFCHSVTLDQVGDEATDRFLAMCSAK